MRSTRTAQEPAVETARRLANPVKNEDREFRASNLAAKQQKLAGQSAASLMRDSKKQSECEKYFKIIPWSTLPKLNSELRKLESNGAKLRAIKDQVYLRTKAHGWKEMQFAFSRLGVALTVEEMTEGLKGITVAEQGRVRPQEIPVSASRSVLLSPLGTLSSLAEKLQMESVWTSEQLRADRTAYETERTADAEKREREWHNAHALDQPEDAPTTIAGLKIEVLTSMQEPVNEDSSELRFYKQWLPAEVSEIEDGTKKRANKAGNKIMAPVGSCFLV